MKQVYFIVTLFFVILFGWQCHQGSGSGNVALDMDARIPDSAADFSPSEVFLRLQIRNTNIDLMKYGLSSSAEQHARQEYYILHFREDIFLISGKDTVECLDCHMEQTNMDLPYRTCLLNFGEHRITDQDALLIMDKVFTDKPLLVSIKKML